MSARGRRANPGLKMRDFHGILSGSEEMFSFFDMLERAAPTESSILIRGESGTGKELAARAIHAISARRGRPFRALNCATLSPELAASELFGHVRGAFTGAVQAREGLFSLANGGTLFLDEIAEMPLQVQARLLRALQEQAFVPIGATTTSRVDVRVVSATLRSLRSAVAQKQFREDLMYRVRVIPLFLPPLSERGRDIEALFWRFIEGYNRTSTGGRAVRHIEEAALEALMAYPWPGNVRELRNVAEYAFVLGQGDTIGLADLTPELREEQPAPSTPAVGAAQTARELERAQLLEALRWAKGRRELAAQRMGVSRTTLWRKLKAHGIT